MNNPYSTIAELPDFDIEFPDDFIEESISQEDLDRADRILDTYADDSTVGFDSYDEWVEEMEDRHGFAEIEEDWAV